MKKLFQFKFNNRCYTFFVAVIMCEEPFLPHHGLLVRSYDKYHFGRRVVYECESGYNLNGTATSQCMVDPEAGHIGLGGTWSNDSPHCQGCAWL